MTLLLSLLKAGGLSAMSIGVVYLLYREIIKLGIVPKLKQWQGFALLSMLALMVFVIAMAVLFHSEHKKEPASTSEATAPTVASSNPTAIVGELPPDSHFQLDSREGVYCQATNVRQASVTYFDMVEINLGACNGSTDYASRTYRVEWLPRGPQSVGRGNRLGFQHCFISDFADQAPEFVAKIQAAFQEKQDAVPCKVSLLMNRLIEIHYVDLRSESMHVAFLQSYNRGGDRRFEMQQIPASDLVRSDAMEPIAERTNIGLSVQDVLNVATEFHYPGVPKPL